MGNTFQQHRISIGIFNSNCRKLSGGCKITENGIKANKSSKRMDVKLVLLLVLLFIGVSSFGGEKCEAVKIPNENKSYNFLPNSVQIINSNFESRYKYGNKQKSGIK